MRSRACRGSRRPLLAGVPALLMMLVVSLLLTHERVERELRESRRRLRFLANIDMLTRVPNRRHFHRAGAPRVRSQPAGTMSVLMFDIDHFKQINDMLGHAAGDRGAAPRGAQHERHAAHERHRRPAGRRRVRAAAAGSERERGDDRGRAHRVACADPGSGGRHAAPVPQLRRRAVLRRREGRRTRCAVPTRRCTRPSGRGAAARWQPSATRTSRCSPRASAWASRRSDQ